ncbi:MAG: glycosyltransferase family 39 protein [Planctomycetota bacterium]
MSAAVPAPSDGNAFLRPGRHVMLVVALGLLAGLLVQGMRGLYRPDEGRYTAVALQMLESGDWWHPHLHHETPHYTKPPLTYWALATSFAVFGHNEFAARLPNMAAFIGTLLLLLAAGRRVTPRRPWLPMVLYSACAFPRIGAHIVTTDTLLTLWTTGAGVAFLRWRFDADRPVRWRRAFWLFLGLGFLTKGPPALLPLLAILGYQLGTERFAGVRRLCDALGLLLFAVVGFGWYAAIGIEYPAVARHWIGNEVVGRIATGVHRRNHDPLYVLVVYIPLFLVGTFPWFWWTWKGLGRGWKARRDPQEPGAFLLVWCLIVFVVLAVAGSRLPLYLLQTMPPLILLAAWASPLTTLRGPRSGALVAALVVIGTLGLAAMRWFPSPADGRVLAQQLMAVLPEPPHEVVFFNKPHHSLQMYLDCEVEHIGLFPGKDEDEHPLQGLADELSEPEPRRVFCVDDSLEKRFRKIGGTLGTVTLLGHTGEYALYAIAPKD